MADYEIIGLRELEKALTTLPTMFHQKVLDAAIKDGAKVIQEEAQTKAPVGGYPHQVSVRGRKSYIAKVKPGFMKKNIKVRTVRTRQGGKSTGYVYLSFKAFYGRFIEYGTSKMSAQPFLRPAFDGKWQEAAGRIRDALRERVSNVARNLAAGMNPRSRGIMR